MPSFMTVAVGDIGAPVEAEMFGLYAAYYERVDRDRFAQDLREKHHVLVMRGDDGQLLGFTTLRLDRRIFGGRPVRAVFSGDTIIHHSQWGRNDLHAAWLRLTGRMKAAEPEVPLYWFLIVMSHRTYRYLSVFTRDYFPRHDPDPATEPRLRAVAHGLAAERFGRHFDPATGVIRFPQSLGQLKGDWAEVPARLADRPEIRFFVARNPDFREGVEMACLTELAVENLKPLGRRFFEEGLAAAEPAFT